MNKNEIIEMLLWILGTIIFFILLIFMCKILSPTEEELLYRQELESRKGACVEYEGNMQGTWFRHGSDGYLECVKWEDTKYKGQYITKY